MVISAITKAIAKATAKKTASSATSGSSLSRNRIKELKEKANSNVRKKYNESNKDKIKEKYDQDAHVKANEAFEEDDITTRYESSMYGIGGPRRDRLTGQLVDPDPDPVTGKYTELSQDLPPNSPELKKRRLEIQKREKLTESTSMYADVDFFNLKPIGQSEIRKTNLAQYHSSNKKFGKAKSVKEMTNNERMDGYQGFESPNKIKIVSRHSYIGDKISKKGVVPVKGIYHEVSGEPIMGHDYHRYIMGGNAPEGQVRASYVDEPSHFGFNWGIPKKSHKKSIIPGSIFGSFPDMNDFPVQMSGPQAKKYTKSLKANKLPSLSLIHI